MNVAEMEIQARADRDEIRRLKAEVERLRTHLTKTDCANCAEAFERSFNAECDAAKTKAAIELHSDASWYAPVKELLDGLKQIVRERDKARAEVERLRKDLGATRDELRTMSGDCERAEAEIERLKQDLADIVENDEGQRGEVARLSAEVERLREALGRVLTEAGLQAHKHGCANKIARPAQWDARLPCAGCQAESALQGR